ncbi:restriction endonuclease subunit S (plasmid) [Acinetobacter sp. WCHAc010034]|uniref:restriction endonuclease subunit S n=1 Tax=Acinetobacter sp. WCHAc010034 TaxID=1879049 RepID=UPI00083AD799|nr:restriction endonuclease subunit S [Acinetobacter sp. WCHAc010034]AYA01466.1 restriction endonuclease subunit S [Acinetobacter sp. WCHAc010034]
MATPKLRFPAFEEKWNKQRLDSFLERVSNPIDVIPNKKYSQIGIRSHGKGIFHKEAVTGEELGNKRVFWVEPNALVVNIVFAWERAIAVTSDAEKGMIASHRFPMYLPKNNLSNVNFLRYLFVTDKGQSYLELASPGGAGRNKTLGQSNFAELKIDLPSLEEQTKIATFLSTVDEKISQLSQKLHLLGQYKQGMMQKLFSQQIRFKANDGSEFGEWGKVKFSESFVFHNTNSYSRALLSEVGEVMNIHYGDIHTKFSMLFDVSKEIVPFLNDQIDSTKIAENQFLKEGDLVIADASEDYKDIGKAIEVVHLNNQKVVAGLHTYIARPVQPFALGFCGYLMQTFEVREQIKKLATGTSVLGISKTNIGKVEIKLPSLEEQTKIANFLSSIDQKIDVVSEQLEQAKLWKKGLLQQMFV